MYVRTCTYIYVAMCNRGHVCTMFYIRRVYISRALDHARGSGLAGRCVSSGFGQSICWPRWRASRVEATAADGCCAGRGGAVCSVPSFHLLCLGLGLFWEAGAGYIDADSGAIDLQHETKLLMVYWLARVDISAIDGCFHAKPILQSIHPAAICRLDRRRRGFRYEPVCARAGAVCMVSGNIFKCQSRAYITRSIISTWSSLE